MDKSIVKITSKNPWKITVIMTWVHGNERSGIDAFKKIIPTIKITSWTVYFVLANLNAIEQNVRFTEKNLNRCFKKRIIGNTYEENRAREIRKILNKADCLLDVHNTFNEINGACLIGENPELTQYFPIKRFLSWIDAIEKWWSDGYMYNRWKIGICLECGCLSDSNWSTIAEQSILNFLKVTWNIHWTPEILQKNPVHIKCYKMYKSKTNNFKLIKVFKDFEDIKKWEIIGYDWDKKILAPRDWLVLFAHDTDAIGKEMFLFTVYAD